MSPGDFPTNRHGGGGGGANRTRPPSSISIAAGFVAGAVAAGKRMASIARITRTPRVDSSGAIPLYEFARRNNSGATKTPRHEGKHEGRRFIFLLVFLRGRLRAFASSWLPNSAS